MSEIYFFDSDDQVPQPRNKVKIERVQAELYPDRYRVWVNIHVTSFQERPNLLLILRNSQNKIVSELSIIETMHANMEFTIHIRGVDDPAGDYTLTVDLFYDKRNPPHDRHVITFTIPEG